MAQLTIPTSFPTLTSVLFDDDVLKRTWIPPVNIKETEQDYEIEMAVPGMKKEDFKIATEKDILNVTAEVKEEEKNKEDENYTRREFSYNSFTRSFSLPQNVDENNIKARYENGVLYITIPKVQETQPKKKTILLS